MLSFTIIVLNFISQIAYCTFQKLIKKLAASRKFESHFFGYGCDNDEEDDIQESGVGEERTNLQQLVIDGCGVCEDDFACGLTRISKAVD